MMRQATHLLRITSSSRFSPVRGNSIGCQGRARLRSFMSSVLYEMSAEVEGLDIGNVFTGAVGAVGRGWAGLPLCFAGRSLVMVCCGPQRPSMQDECANFMIRDWAGVLGPTPHRHNAPTLLLGSRNERVRGLGRLIITVIERHSVSMP